jgi:hypothetical protein
LVTPIFGAQQYFDPSPGAKNPAREVVKPRRGSVLRSPYFNLSEAYITVTKTVERTKWRRNTFSMPMAYARKT